MSGKLPQNSGVTLMEVLLAAFLMGVVGLAVAAISTSTQMYLWQSTTMATTQGEASYGVEHIKRYLSMGSRVVLYSASRIAFRYDHGAISGGTATSLNTNDDNWDYYGWDPSNNTLVYRQAFVAGANPGATDPADPDVTGVVNGASPTVIARGVTAFTLAQPSGADIDVDLTALSTVGPTSRQSRVRSTVSPRGMSTN